MSDVQQNKFDVIIPDEIFIMSAGDELDSKKLQEFISKHRNLILNRYFIDKNMYMIEARYNQDNIPSSKLLQKLGFVVDGKIRNRRIDYLTGERRDMVICSITMEEYKEKIHYEEK